MKPLSSFAAVAIAALLPALAAAASLTADSHISAVAVYSDRAVVTRTAHVDLGGPGPVEITFPQLPAGLVEQSLQVAARGAAQLTLLDVTARASYVDFTPNERVKTLEDELHGLARQDRTLTDRSGVLNHQRDYVLKIQTATTTPVKDSDASAPGPDAWMKLLGMTEEQLNKIAAEMQSIDAQREELQVKRTALEQQLNQLRGEGGRSFKSVTVRVAASAAGAADVTLRYAVGGASWTPVYDARVLTSDRAVQLGYFGLVRQNTGEDWNDVDVTLSTARPSLGGSPPPLYPWIVDVRQFLPVAAAAPAGAGGNFKAMRNQNLAVNTQQFTDSASELRLREEVDKDAVALQAEIQTQATSASFHIPVAATIRSDNAPQRLPITSTRLTAEPEFLAIPKQLKAAFLTAKVTNNSEFPLLAGTLNVFLDDSFVAASALRSVMPGEKFDLALGADEGIAVKRKLNNRFTEDTGVMTKSKRITYDYTITLQNNKKTAEKIVVLDQLPVSRNEKIVVKVITPEEREVKPDSEGTLKWTLTLAPGEKRELPLKFSVEYPAELNVTGVE
jgi:uncharacterized protein (TIGR02231 family)